MGAAPTFKGVPLLLAGVEYTLPKLSFGGFDDAKDRMEQIANGTVKDPSDLQNAFIDVIHAALLRNYPGIDRQLIKNELDWDTAPALFHQLLTMSIPGAPAGETRVVSPSGASTGKRRSPK